MCASSSSISAPTLLDKRVAIDAVCKRPGTFLTFAKWPSGLAEVLEEFSSLRMLKAVVERTKVVVFGYCKNVHAILSALTARK